VLLLALSFVGRRRRSGVTALAGRPPGLDN